MSNRSKEPGAHVVAVPRHRLVLVGFVFVALVSIVGYLTQRAPAPIVSRENPLEVKTLIQAVRGQLAAAEADRIQNKEIALFALREFEMEINFVVRNSGGVKAEVVGVGTSIDTLSERVQKLRLRWDAVPPQEFKSDANDLEAAKKTLKPKRLETD